MKINLKFLLFSLFSLFPPVQIDLIDLTGQLHRADLLL